MKTVLFCGAKEVGFKCLEHLLAAASELNVRVIGVVSGVPRSSSLNSKYDFEKLSSTYGVPYFGNELPEGVEYDFLVSVQFNRLFRAAELKRAKIAPINLHMAPLPRYRGANQFSLAIMNGDKEFGTTLHIMNEKADAGPIYSQIKFPIADNINVLELYNLTTKASVELFQRDIGEIFNNRIEPQPQAVDAKVETFFSKKSDVEKLKEINPSWPIEKIDRWVRAFDMPGFEPPFFKYKNEKIYLTKRSN